MVLREDGEVVIEYKEGNLLDSQAEALVNAVNCVGVMGKGIALQFKQAYPDNFKAYKEACNNNRVTPGKMFIVDSGSMSNPRYIINFPTKRHWRGKSRMEDIQSGLIDFVDQLREYGIHSVAIPPLGCGHGGLDWDQVRPLIEETALKVPDVLFLVYPPHESRESDSL